MFSELMNQLGYLWGRGQHGGLRKQSQAFGIPTAAGTPVLRHSQESKATPDVLTHRFPSGALSPSAEIRESKQAKQEGTDPKAVGPPHGRRGIQRRLC